MFRNDMVWADIFASQSDISKQGEKADLFSLQVDTRAIEMSVEGPACNCSALIVMASSSHQSRKAGNAALAIWLTLAKKFAHIANASKLSETCSLFVGGHRPPLQRTGMREVKLRGVQKRS
jgi:hypothetical protein